METDALTIRGLAAGYGAVRALDGVSMSVRSGETVALLGTNGNGKTTLMRCVLGLVRPWEGAVRAKVGGRTADLDRLEPEEIVALGIVLVPEGRRLFRDLSVEDNLALGAYRPAARKRYAENLARCYEMFPRLRERRRQRVGSMSGGEQQMVALGRAIMAAPEILLVDEPSVGLAPILVRQTIDAIADLKRRLGLTVLMAEQNLAQAIRVVDRGYVLAHGRVAFEAHSAAELAENPIVRDIYLGR
ncbi:MAG TPA: ABC transporter ATP-binding protein [Roseiarcus sp.]|nr:ABC transporter ATP-binding protein [Roseiarcus sp.]